MIKDLPNTYSNTEPLISVITVVYNDKKNLQKTIQSVINQTYKNIDYIIIDGGSTDDTLDVIHENEGNINYWVSEIDEGIYDAMNKGIGSVSGDYLVFLNAGDVFSSNEILDLVAKSAVVNDHPDIMYGQANIFSKDGEFLKKLAPLRFSRLNLTLFGTRTVCHQSIFVKTEIAPHYDTSYRLKAELCWYYEILKQNTHLNIIPLFFPVSNYALGGVGDVLFIDNILERVSVVAKQEGIFVSIITVPFLMIPFLFRLKRKLLDIFFNNRVSSK